MESQIKPIMRLINEFSKLPGVGKRTATRYVYKIIEMSGAETKALISAIEEVKERVHYCKECGAFSENEMCELCRTRDKKIICVVKDPKDISTIERMGVFKGVYHVLGGTISPLKGISVDDLRVKELLARLSGVEEVILALSPDVEGDATCLYIKKLLHPLEVKTTRLAHGIPLGQDIEFADDATLARAITERTLF